ncbi:MAG: hypothetical protein PHW56_00300 [Methanosarcinaceae archaeon]|nr:hypothetical protein [Methanosarcinaceae archaeon]
MEEERKEEKNEGEKEGKNEEKKEGATVEPIHPHDERVSKKRSLLDTCR